MIHQRSSKTGAVNFVQTVPEWDEIRVQEIRGAVSCQSEKIRRRGNMQERGVTLGDNSWASLETFSQERIHLTSSKALVKGLRRSSLIVEKETLPEQRQISTFWTCKSKTPGNAQEQQGDWGWRTTAAAIKRVKAEIPMHAWWCAGQGRAKELRRNANVVWTLTYAMAFNQIANLIYRLNNSR